MTARPDEMRRRSAASRKGWQSRRARAAIAAGTPLMTPEEIAALRGTRTGDTLSPEGCRTIIRMALDNLKAREAQS